MNIAFAQTAPDLGKNLFFQGDAAHDRWLDAFGDFRRALEEAGHRCETLDMFELGEIDVLVTTRYDLRFGAMLQVLRARPDCRIVLWAIEEPVVCGLHEAEILTRLDCDLIMTWRDDLVDGKKLVWAAIPQPSFMPERLRTVPFAERKLINAIYANKSFRHPRELYSGRRDVIRQMGRLGVLDLYGGGWQDAEPEIRAIWRGRVGEKYDVQRGYRFTLCFENSADYIGDITEKPFDALAAGTIPVYLGAPNFADYIPRDCFVDYRDFPSVEALVSYLQAMPEEEFERRLNAIARYMAGDFARDFSGQTQARTLLRELARLDASPRRRRRAIPYFIGAVWRCALGLLRPPWHRKLASLWLILKMSLLGDRVWRA